MKSRFPGLDPYIEACHLWEGFHTHLIEDIYRTIAKQLPEGYYADIGTRTYVVFVNEDGKEEGLAKPDVAVTGSRANKPSKPKRKTGTTTASVAEDESIAMEAFIAEQFKEAFVEIYAAGEEPYLVTGIELRSPSNKRQGTEGWDLYLRKRQAMLLGRANFIEIDLLRGGTRFPMLTPWPACPYTLLVSRSMFAPRCRVWPAHFTRRLPVIPVPLLPQDADLSLDLQPLIDGIYSLGRYRQRIDYTKPLSPPLTEEEATWVKGVLTKR